MALNLLQLRTYVRDLTGVYSTDIISDALLTRWINESYRELTNSQNWPWAPLVIDLVNDTDTVVVALIDTYLSYRTAVKVLNFEADDTTRAEQYGKEAASVYDQLVLQYLSGATFFPPTTGTDFNKYVRFLLGTYNDAVDDSFIQVKLAEISQELLARYNWPFLSFQTNLHYDMLAYAVARDLSIHLNKDQAFAAYMDGQYEAKLLDLVLQTFNNAADGFIDTQTRLVQYIRFLLNDYSKSISDAFLLNKFTELEQELVNAYPWPTDIIEDQPGVPLLGWANAEMLCYAVARETGQFVDKDDAFAERMNATYQVKLDDLVLVTFKKFAVGAAIDDMPDLVAYVRFLTGVYTDDINDFIIEMRLREAAEELWSRFTWPWTTDLGNTGGLSFYDAHALAYDVARKIAAQRGGAQGFVDGMTAQYDIAVARLKQTYIIDVATAGTTDLGALRATTRLVTGEFGRIVPDAILNLWINEEYQLLCNEKDWAWLEQTTQGTFPSGTSQLTLPNGTRNVLEMYMVEKVAAADGADKAVAQSEIIHPVPHVMDIERNADKFRYDVTSAGVVTISPAPTRSFTIRARYRQAANSLSVDTDTPLMANQFRSILAYRAGLRVASYTGAPKAVAELCAATAQRMFEAMDSFYQLEHSMEPFQVGGLGLETRKYLPWFRTA